MSKQRLNDRELLLPARKDTEYFTSTIIVYANAFYIRCLLSEERNIYLRQNSFYDDEGEARESMKRFHLSSDERCYQLLWKGIMRSSDGHSLLPAQIAPGNKKRRKAP